MNEFSLSKRWRGRPPVPCRGLDSVHDPLFAEVLPVGPPSLRRVSRTPWVAEVVLPSGLVVRLARNAPSRWVELVLRSC